MTTKVRGQKKPAVTQEAPSPATDKREVKITLTFRGDDVVVLTAMQGELSAARARPVTHEEAIAEALREWLSTRRVKRWLQEMLEEGS